MTIDRRNFLLGTASGLAAAACGGKSSNTAASQPTTAAPAPAPAKPTPKSILILGGTVFLGPHLVEAARKRGHTVTLFNRGKTRPNLFPDVEKLQGDRDGKLEALAGRKWDAVIDTSGYVPRVVKMSAELLAPHVQQYIFISTVSVYANNDKPDADETAPLATMPDPTSEEVKVHYGALKALCEQAAEAAMPGRVANIRPGLIIGPGDPSGRYTHWATRMADGGEVLCPGNGTTPTQYIDGRDLALWIVKCVENNTVGIFNALGPVKRTTMREALEGTNAGAGGKPSLVWVDTAFLEKHDVKPWSEMPMWFDATGEMAGFGTTSNARAVKAGLTFRPIAETSRDTLAWLPEVATELESNPNRDKILARFRSTGIDREKEAKVIAAWKAR